MRMWHYKLLPYLPVQQLTGQWKELHAIIGEMEKFGELKRSRGYLLVTPMNKIRKGELAIYTQAVHNNGISTWDKCQDLLRRIAQIDWKGTECMSDWHTDDYLKQCFYNLQEKYMCGGITEAEYRKLEYGYYKEGGTL